MASWIEEEKLEYIRLLWLDGWFELGISNP
jgi:hypothetical protein